MDGILLDSATILGAFKHGTNPIIIESGSNTYNYDEKEDWYMDELQIWKRALTPNEVIALSQHQAVSQENCVVKLGFDGTLKDLSGHGNDAVAQLNCNLVEYEGIQVPTPKMQISRNPWSREVSFIDKTENGEAIFWSFDDPRTYSESMLRHPKHEYSEPCIAHPMMLARGANACAAITSELIIPGLAKVEPSIVEKSDGIFLSIYR